MATSAPPAIAVVQLDVITSCSSRAPAWIVPDRVATARTDPGLPANGRPEAADYLARRGARLDLPGAAGLGRLDDVKRLFDERGNLNRAPRRSTQRGLLVGLRYGRANVVEFLLERGVGSTPSSR